ISTIKNSSGLFWMPYGDDDVILEGSLKKIIENLKKYPEAVLHVYSGEGKDTLVSISEITRNQYYNIGNCGIPVIKTTSLRNQFDKFQKLLHCTCWPITQAAYTAIGLENEPLAYHASYKVSASPNHRENTSYSAWYVVYTPVYALLYLSKRLR